MATPSFDDLYNIGKAEMLLKRPDLFLAPGDISDFVVAAAAAMADKNVGYAAEEFRKTFIDGATWDDLTTLVSDHYNLSRNPATAATVTLSFTRPSAGGGEPAGTLATGFKVSTAADASGARQEYTTNADVSWALGETGTKTVLATSVVVGRAGNVGANTIQNLVGSPFDSTITVNNTAVAAGGNEVESDDQLRARARAFSSTLRRGTLAALEFGAKIVPTVRVATASEDSNGVVTVFVTDADGNSNVQMVNDVIAELENWRAAGVPVGVTGGAKLTQNISVTLIVKAGTVVANLVASIQAAVTERMAKLPVGNGSADSEGVLRLEVIQATCISVDPENIIGVVVNVPSAAVVPAAGQIIRAGTVTVN